MTLLDSGSLLTAICYLLATTAVISRLFHPKGPNLVAILFLACSAILLHSFTINQLMFTNDAPNFALSNVISLVSLVITILVTLIALKYKINLLLPVAYGFAGIWQFVSLFIPQTASFPLQIENLPVYSHVTVALVAYCILIIATLYAFQVAYINFKLKNKNLLAVSHLPPLMQVEAQLFTILALGTACLFISELTGFLFLDDFFAKEKAHKTVLSLIALVLYCFILFVHYRMGWRGHKVLVLTISATSLLTLAYFGSRFVKEFLL